MQESLNPRSPLIYTPKSLTELINNIAKSKEAVIWAGGMHIMSREGFYPDTESRDIISLGSVPELFRINGTEHMIEAGSMVTIDKLVASGLIPQESALMKALMNIGTFVVRSQATLGGTLAIPKERFALCSLLGSIGADVEVMFVNRTSTDRRKNYRHTSRWYPLPSIYDGNGRFIHTNDAIITKVRIPIASVRSLIYRTVGSVANDPTESVCYSLSYMMENEKLSMPDLCVTLPNGGFFRSTELNGNIGSLDVPISRSTMSTIASRFETELKQRCQEATAIQCERARRLLLSSLQKINGDFMAMASRDRTQSRERDL